MRSVMNHKFSEVPSVSIPRSTFDRSHGFKTTFDSGYLIPILVDEALPGDTFKVNVTAFARLATPIYPIMDNMILETFFFAVPNRLLWEHWPNFMGERKPNPDSSIDYLVPVVNDLVNADNESLWDYFGLPTKVTDTYEFNALVPRAYNLIWNEWFRDQNLQDSVTVNTGDGPDSEADYTLLRRAKRHDYFTSCLPWLQKGDAVLLSLGQSADVHANVTSSGDYSIYNEANSTWQKMNTSAVSNRLQQITEAGLEANKLFVDLQTATGPTVNELRQAIQIQRLLEKDARAGTRYIEIIQSHFGVTSPDFRMQRPEYLGGGRAPVVVKPIARTDSFPGVLGAVGMAGFKNHGFVKSFTEHCVIIGLMSVRADLTYQEGIEKHWNRQTKYDFYWPTLAHLGEQAVLNKEIYIDATTIGSGASEEVFGYQERYAEYRYKPSKITGKFRSNDTASLDAWHLGIEFGSQPTLDATFIEDNPPVDRVIAVPSEPHFIYDSYVNMQCTRPMPTYSVPGMIDHF